MFGQLLKLHLNTHGQSITSNGVVYSQKMIMKVRFWTDFPGSSLSKTPRHLASRRAARERENLYPFAFILFEDFKWAGRA